MRRSLKIGAALVAMVFVLAIFIAPMIDMPETVLREHHVTAHATSGQMIGAPSTVDGFSFTHLPTDLSSLHLPARTHISGNSRSVTVTILRC